jgi:uncharacterized protein
MKRRQAHTIQARARPAPPSSMNLPPFLRSQGNEVLLSVKVQPRASRNEIGEALGDELKIKVTAPPVDSAANEALIRFLAEQLGCGRGAVRLLRGNSSRHKVISIAGMTAEMVWQRLTTPR